MSWAEYVKTMKPEEETHVFAKSGNTALLRQVLTHETLNLADPRGHTPLILACYNNHFETVELLLSSGADPNLRDHSGNTALMGAAFKGYLEIVRLLIQNGADPSLANPQGLTALGFAKLFGRTEVEKYLARYSAQSESEPS